MVRSLYGTRDAPMNWELTIAEFMKKLGFVQEKSNPCIYYHASRELRTEMRGDDFTTVGSFDDIKYSWFHIQQPKNGKLWNEAFWVRQVHQRQANRSEC